MARSIYVVCEDHDSDLGHINEIAQRNGYSPQVFTRVSRDLIAFDERVHSAVILMGGCGDHPTYPAEYDCLAAAIASKRPVLAICQGAQVLATLHTRNPRSIKLIEYPDAEDQGLLPLNLTGDGKVDPVMMPIAETGARMAQSHSYTVKKLHKSAVQLAHSPSGLHCDAFRLNALTYGLQFHPEVPSWLKESECDPGEYRKYVDCADQVVQAWFDTTGLSQRRAT